MPFWLCLRASFSSSFCREATSSSPLSWERVGRPAMNSGTCSRLGWKVCPVSWRSLSWRPLSRASKKFQQSSAISSSSCVTVESGLFSFVSFAFLDIFTSLFWWKRAAFSSSRFCWYLERTTSPCTSFTSIVLIFSLVPATRPQFSLLVALFRME